MSEREVSEKKGRAKEAKQARSTDPYLALGVEESAADGLRRQVDGRQYGRDGHHEHLREVLVDLPVAARREIPAGRREVGFGWGVRGIVAERHHAVCSLPASPVEDEEWSRHCGHPKMEDSIEQRVAGVVLVGAVVGVLAVRRRVVCDHRGEDDDGDPV